MIYTPEKNAPMSNRMSPELNKEVAERIAELLAMRQPDATEEDVDRAEERTEEDA